METDSKNAQLDQKIPWEPVAHNIPMDFPQGDLAKLLAESGVYYTTPLNASLEVQRTHHTIMAEPEAPLTIDNRLLIAELPSEAFAKFNPHGMPKLEFEFDIGERFIDPEHSYIKLCLHTSNFWKPGHAFDLVNALLPVALRPRIFWTNLLTGMQLQHKSGQFIEDWDPAHAAYGVWQNFKGMYQRNSDWRHSIGSTLGWHDSEANSAAVVEVPRMDALQYDELVADYPFSAYVEYGHAGTFVTNAGTVIAMQRAPGDVNTLESVAVLPAGETWSIGGSVPIITDHVLIYDDSGVNSANNTGIFRVLVNSSLAQLRLTRVIGSAATTDWLSSGDIYWRGSVIWAVNEQRRFANFNRDEFSFPDATVTDVQWLFRPVDELDPSVLPVRGVTVYKLQHSVGDGGALVNEPVRCVLIPLSFLSNVFYQNRRRHKLLSPALLAGGRLRLFFDNALINSLRYVQSWEVALNFSAPFQDAILPNYNVTITGAAMVLEEHYLPQRLHSDLNHHQSRVPAVHQFETATCGVREDTAPAQSVHVDTIGQWRMRDNVSGAMASTMMLRLQYFTLETLDVLVTIPGDTQLTLWNIYDGRYLNNNTQTLQINLDHDSYLNDVAREPTFQFKRGDYYQPKQRFPLYEPTLALNPLVSSETYNVNPALMWKLHVSNRRWVDQLGGSGYRSVLMRQGDPTDTGLFTGTQYISADHARQPFLPNSGLEANPETPLELTSGERNRLISQYAIGSNTSLRNFYFVHIERRIYERGDNIRIEE